MSLFTKLLKRLSAHSDKKRTFLSAGQIILHSIRHFSSSSLRMTSLDSLNFDNLALRKLPLDKEAANFVRQVSGACFSRVEPAPLRNPRTVAYSFPALQLLDLAESECARTDFATYFGGNAVLPGSEPAAHCYCGHQFGYFSGQLGDGATMYLGEVVNRSGERWELQLKGAGKTPYSRSADGRKVLRSSIREFLCSEAMHNLGIPTTRAGSCVTSDSRVNRDIYYTGNNIQERCTVISRICPTFIRFGSFEICKPTDRETGRKGPSAGQPQIISTLAHYVIQTFYPRVWDDFQNDCEKMYEEFLREVCLRTARLVARWQCCGFCHGVLNTDNMSIIGVTIDYGPFGFMERYDPNYVCNSSDDAGRYAYGRQPEICRWNCAKLAEALQPMLPLNRSRTVLDEYDSEFEKEYWSIMRRKFGIFLEKEGDREFMEDFLKTMYESGSDFTNSFRVLSKLHSNEDIAGVVQYLLLQCCSAQQYKRAFSPQMDPTQLQMLLMLQNSNPEILSMLGKQAGALQRELELTKKSESLKNLTPAIKADRDRHLWTTWLKKYLARIDEEKSCYDSVDEWRNRRIQMMNQTNPRIVLRNHIAQNAIEEAENGDFAEVWRVLRAFENPYAERGRWESFQETDEGNTGVVDEDVGSSNPIACDSKGKAKKCKVQFDIRAPEESIIRVS